MRAKLLAAVSILIIAAALSQVAWGNLSPRHSEETLRENLLKEVPLGGSMQQVRMLIERNEWELEQFDTERGFLDQRVRPSTITGARSIEAYLGSYQGIPWEADVSVYWAFDDAGKLVDIWVWKTWNTL